MPARIESRVAGTRALRCLNHADHVEQRASASHTYSTTSLSLHAVLHSCKSSRARARAMALCPQRYSVAPVSADDLCAAERFKIQEAIFSELTVALDAGKTSCDQMKPLHAFAAADVCTKVIDAAKTACTDLAACSADDYGAFQELMPGPAAERRTLSPPTPRPRPARAVRPAAPRATAARPARPAVPERA